MIFIGFVTSQKKNKGVRLKKITSAYFHFVFYKTILTGISWFLFSVAKIIIGFDKAGAVGDWLAGVWSATG